LQTCDELGVEPAVKAEIVSLLDNLQQLLIGICIMQVGSVGIVGVLSGFGVGRSVAERVQALGVEGC
jgi:hypothetical protein